MLRKLRGRMAAMKAIAELLQGAEAIARGRGLQRPGAEHLVLAALELSDGTAQTALERLGSSGAELSATLDAIEAEDLAAVGIRAPDDRIDAALPPATRPDGVHRSDPSAQQLFQLAGQDARDDGGQLVGAHVLRSAAELEHGPVARALRRMEIDSGALREAATAAIDGHAGPADRRR